MTRDLSEQMQHFAGSVERAAVTIISAALRAIASILLNCLILLLRLTKPFILYPLILGMIGGVGAAIAFGFNHH